MRLAALALPLVLTAPISASAAPYARPDAQSARIETQAGAGLSLPQPDLAQAIDGVEIHGAVCRLPSHAMSGAVGVRVQHLDPQGRVMAQTDAAVSGSLGRRARGCAFYSVHAAWIVAPTEMVRICADKLGRANCTPHAAAD